MIIVAQYEAKRPAPSKQTTTTIINHETENRNTKLKTNYKEVVYNIQIRSELLIDIGLNNDIIWKKEI